MSFIFPLEFPSVSLKPQFSPIIFFSSQYHWDNITPKYSHYFHSCCLKIHHDSLHVIYLQPEHYLHSRPSKAQHSSISQTNHTLAPNKANVFPSHCCGQMYYYCKSEGTFLLPILRYLSSSLFPQIFIKNIQACSLRAILHISENVYFAFFFPQSQHYLLTFDTSL